MVDALERHPGRPAVTPLHGATARVARRRATRVRSTGSAALVERDQVEILGGGLVRAGPRVAPRARPGRPARRGWRTTLERPFGRAAHAARGSRSASGSRTCRRRSSPPATTGRSSTTRISAPRRSPRTDLWGPYTTEDQGRHLTVFGTEQGLRYRIPFRDVDDVIAYLRDPRDRDGRPSRDDGRRRREVRRLAHDLGALLGRGRLGRAVLRRRSRTTRDG